VSRFDFVPAELPPEAFMPERYMAMGLTEKEADAIVSNMKLETVWLSDTYQVNVRETKTPGGGHPITWLSIKRRDKEPFHDWREMQQIKNAICGPEREGVELYPAESRLTDSANQYHLWVLPEGQKFPFGFDTRFVVDSDSFGAKQRPFEQENRS
jgi:hypothetical protein